MFVLRKIFTATMICLAASETTALMAMQETIYTEDERNTKNSCITKETSATKSKRIPRKCHYLIAGRTEAEDQAIVTTATCSLLTLNLVNAFNALTHV